MNDILAIRVDSYEALETSKTNGAYWIGEVDGEHLGIWYRCPCCGEPNYVPFRREPEQHPSWQWDGNLDKPTLNPSIKRLGGCMWHGWLQQGVWKTC